MVHSKSATGRKLQKAVSSVLRRQHNKDAIPLHFHNKVLTFDVQFPMDSGAIQSAEAKAQDLAQVQASSVDPPPGLASAQSRAGEAQSSKPAHAATESVQPQDAASGGGESKGPIDVWSEQFWQHPRIARLYGVGGLQEISAVMSTFSRQA